MLYNQRRRAAIKPTARPGSKRATEPQLKAESEHYAHNPFQQWHLQVCALHS